MQVHLATELFFDFFETVIEIIPGLPFYVVGGGVMTVTGLGFVGVVRPPVHVPVSNLDFRGHVKEPDYLRWLVEVHPNH